MKALLIAVLMVFTFTANANDKLLHAGGSFVLTNVFMGMGMTKKQAFLTTLFIGALKEMGDNNTPEEHAKDMFANALGAGGAIIVFRYEF